MLAQKTALSAALEKLNEAIQLIPGDKQLSETATGLVAKVNKLQESAQAAEKPATAAKTPLEAAQKELAEKRLRLTALQAEVVPSGELKSLEQTQIQTAERLSAHLFELEHAQRLSRLCDALTEYQLLRHSDMVKAGSLWQSIVESWTVQGQLAPLKALTPEQLTMSAMQGAGVLNRYVTEAQAQAKAIQAKALAKSKATAEAADTKAATTDDKKKASDDAASPMRMRMPSNRSPPWNN